jgi:hypothetical protein
MLGSAPSCWKSDFGNSAGDAMRVQDTNHTIELRRVNGVISAAGGPAEAGSIPVAFASKSPLDASCLSFPPTEIQSDRKNSKPKSQTP